MQENELNNVYFEFKVDSMFYSYAMTCYIGPCYNLSIETYLIDIHSKSFWSISLY